MSRKQAARLAGAALLATGAVVGLTTPTAASADSLPADPELVAAMQRDLGLTEAQARTRLAQEDAAIRLNDTLSRSLGDEFAGSRFDAGRGALVVAVTDAARSADVRAAGADAVLVRRSASELAAVVSTLDKIGASAPSAVTGWYVDPADNSVVVTVNRRLRDAAADGFLAQARSVSDSVRVEETDHSPETQFDIVGGDAFNTPEARCSIGFSVRTSNRKPGMVTAGHCGTAGTPVTGKNGVAMGTIRGSSFPENDFAWVAANSDWTAQPWVNMYDGRLRVVNGATPAPVGTSICRSGSTTGWHCGTVETLNQTVRYSNDRVVQGMTGTNVCSEPGDSGGSYISGGHAQGIHSGGSGGDCGTPDRHRSYFQPLQEVLDAYKLKLVVDS
jgi:streptogrisin C